jgi:hypothetical protein
MRTVRWIVPEAPEPPSAQRTGPRLQVAGRPLRLGLLDNTKDNAGLLLALVGERVRQAYGAQLLTVRKGNATLPAAPALLDQLAREADCVLTAMAD